MKTKYGYMACPDCNARVVVKVNEQETLSYNCEECDSNAYSRKGAGNRAAWEKRITRTPAPDTKPDDDKKPAGGGEKKGGLLDDIL